MQERDEKPRFVNQISTGLLIRTAFTFPSLLATSCSSALLGRRVATGGRGSGGLLSMCAVRRR